MNINATLILQSIAMMIFVWFCMKFIWPPLLKAMDDRRAKVADGLAASDRAEKELEAAKLSAGEQILEARNKAGEIVDLANQRHSQILDQAKEDATSERQRQVAARLAVSSARPNRDPRTAPTMTPAAGAGRTRAP